MNGEAAREADAGPGPLLRRAREAQGLTEQQAAEQLNLDATIVEALERNDLAALGAPVFAKGHLRRYGGLLGLAEDELLAAYARTHARPEAPSLVPKSRQEMMPERGRPKWPWVLGGLLAFVAAAGLVAYVSENGLRLPANPFADGPQAAEPASGDGVDATATGMPASDTDPADATASAAGGSVAGSATMPPGVGAAILPLPAGHVSVTLAFAADSWAEIYDGSGQAVLYDLGRAGTQRTVAAAAPLSVAFGNAPAVALAVNGRPTKMPSVPAGQTVARFSIQADGSLR